jgi:DNA-binding PadR family transcriptional regulator
MIRGYLIPCLLFLLKDSPSHGYQLIEKLETRAYLKEVPDPGVLYRHLRHLEQEGMVTSNLEPGDGPARKVYTLTDAGSACLKRWTDNLRQLKTDLDRFLLDAVADKKRSRTTRARRRQ